jgi:hypothetical protein
MKQPTVTITYGGDEPSWVLSDLVDRAVDSEWVVSVSAYGRLFENVVIVARVEAEPHVLIVRHTKDGDYKVDEDQPGYLIDIDTITRFHIH